MRELRKGIGAIILNKNNKILAFQRTDYDAYWQGVEGGIDDNENPIDTLYREVKEEIGVNREDYEVLKEYNGFIPYMFPEGIVKKNNIKK